MMEQSGNVSQLLWTIYGIVFLYFLLGGFSFYFINRKKSRVEARKSYVKFFTYFVIINIIFISMAFWPLAFRYIAMIIIGLGLFEIIRLFVLSNYQLVLFFIGSMMVYIIFAIGFYRFSEIDHRLMLYAFLVASIFDSFSQITGQLWGRRKILPRISPNKTVGGVLGGALVALLSGYLLGDLYETTNTERLILTGGLILFAFLGDALASLFKRKYEVKDFSQMIPAHGGVLDRFDSLLACGAWVAFYFYVL